MPPGPQRASCPPPPPPDVPARIPVPRAGVASCRSPSHQTSSWTADGPASRSVPGCFWVPGPSPHVAEVTRPWGARSHPAGPRRAGGAGSTTSQGQVLA